MLSPQSSPEEDPAPNGVHVNAIEEDDLTISSESTPMRKESLRDRRTRNRQAQRIPKGDGTLSPTDANTYSSTGVTLPPLASIIPPPPKFATSPDSEYEAPESWPSDPERASKTLLQERYDGNLPLNGPMPIDTRKLTRIAQAMGLFPSDPFASVRSSATESNPQTISASRSYSSLSQIGFSPVRSVFGASSSRISNHNPPTIRKSLSERSISTGSVLDTGRHEAMGKSPGRHLIQIVPPDDLFAASGMIPPNLVHSGLQEENLSRAQKKELKRWRRGRLLPLKATMGTMKTAIVREWNLPSDVGMIIYLVNEGDHSHKSMEGDSSETTESDSEVGTKITSEAWKIFWAHLYDQPRFSRRASHERSAPPPLPTERDSPTHLQNGAAGNLTLPTVSSNEDQVAATLLGADAKLARPMYGGLLTPTTAKSFRTDPHWSPGKSSSVAPSASVSQVNSPMWLGDRTTQNPHERKRLFSDPYANSTSHPKIVGKIEFDFDRSKAAWYETWLKRRRDATVRPVPHQGLKPLLLGTQAVERSLSVSSASSISGNSVNQFPDDSYALLSEEPNEEAVEETSAQGTAETHSPEAVSDESLSPVESEEPALGSREDPLADVFGDEQDEFARLRSARPIDTLSVEPDSEWRHIGSSFALNSPLVDETKKLEPQNDVEDVAMLIAETAIVDQNKSPQLDVPLVDQNKTPQLGVPIVDQNQTPQLGVPTSQITGLASPIDILSPQTVNRSGVEIRTSLPDTPVPAEDDTVKVNRLSVARAENPIMFGLGMGFDIGFDKRGSSLVMSDQLDALEKAMQQLSPRELRLSMMRTIDSGVAGTLESEIYEQVRRSSQQGDAAIRSDEKRPSSNHSPQLPNLDDGSGAMSTPEGTPQIASSNDLKTQNKFTPRSVPDGTAPIPLSQETMERMKYELIPARPPPGSEPGWRPPRPARPPSPALEQYIAPSPPLHLREHFSPIAETRFPDVESHSLPPTRPENGKGKGLRSQKSVPKLNKLFNRKHSVETEEPPMVTRISGPIALTDFPSPLSSPTPEEVGTFTLPANGSDTAAYKSPKLGSFGRRLFKGSFGSHGRSVSSPKIPPAIGHGPAPNTPANIRSPSNPLPQRKRSESSPSPNPIDRTFSARVLHPLSPSLEPPGSPSSPTTSVKRKPVQRTELDAFLPTSQSGVSLASFVLEDPPRNGKHKTQIDGQ